jgi:hypothetical protein
VLVERGVGRGGRELPLVSRERLGAWHTQRHEYALDLYDISYEHIPIIRRDASHTRAAGWRAPYY